MRAGECSSGVERWSISVEREGLSRWSLRRLFQASPEDLDGLQKLTLIPASIFRMPPTVVGLPKNGDVIVPL